MANREYPDSPRVGVGAVVLRENRILLVRRGAAPANGLWAIPGGALELGETLTEGAEREILEETGIAIRAGDPVFTCDVLVRDDEGRVRFHYVIVDLAADYLSGEVMGGDDAIEARWVAPEELPELPVTKTTLKYLAPYVFKVAISNSRIIKVENRIVTFKYRKHGSVRYRSVSLDVMEFLRRFLQHVLPSGFMKVRHGFCKPDPLKPSRHR